MKLHLCSEKSYIVARDIDSVGDESKFRCVVTVQHEGHQQIMKQLWMVAKKGKADKATLVEWKDDTVAYKHGKASARRRLGR